MYRFLFDAECAEYKYYQYRVAQEEAVLAAETGASQIVHAGLHALDVLCSGGI